MTCTGCIATVTSGAISILLKILLGKRRGMLAGGGLLAGIGFTMALFIANLSFGENLIGSAKLGIFLASVVSAFAGLALLTCTTRGSTRPVPTL